MISIDIQTTIECALCGNSKSFTNSFQNKRDVVFDIYQELNGWHYTPKNVVCPSCVKQIRTVEADGA